MGFRFTSLRARVRVEGVHMCLCWQLGSLRSRLRIRLKSLRVRVRVEGVHVCWQLGSLRSRLRIRDLGLGLGLRVSGMSRVRLRVEVVG